eukprot:scaffold41466_cov145-Amphora_coffeaeformis.AAC.1
MNERVIYTPDSAHPERFLPQVAGAGAAIRPFEVEDMNRVEDFGDENLPEAPPDGELMFATDSELDNLKFPPYHFCLRGGYLFYFEPDDVEDESGHMATYHDVPVGVVPLRHVTVQYPPGGRRCFREHAQSPARTGYEVALVHIPEETEDEVEESSRPVVFLVAGSLSLREKWAAAMRERAEIDKPTILKGGYTRTFPAAPKPAPVAAASQSFDEDDNDDGAASKDEEKKAEPSKPEAAKEFKKEEARQKAARSGKKDFFKKKKQPRGEAKS